MAEEIVTKYSIPIYFYEGIGTQALNDRTLPTFEKARYEGLKTEIARPERRPDRGEPRMHPSAGATVIGARKPLIAYNINLNTSDIKVAKDIAKRAPGENRRAHLCKGAGRHAERKKSGPGLDEPHRFFKGAPCTPSLRW